jgi:hypothetical protein
MLLQTEEDVEELMYRVWRAGLSCVDAPGGASGHVAGNLRACANSGHVVKRDPPWLAGIIDIYSGHGRRRFYDPLFVETVEDIEGVARRLLDRWPSFAKSFVRRQRALRPCVKLDCPWVKLEMTDPPGERQMCPVCLRADEAELRFRQMVAEVSGIAECAPRLLPDAYRELEMLHLVENYAGGPGYIEERTVEVQRDLSLLVKAAVLAREQRKGDSPKSPGKTPSFTFGPGQALFDGRDLNLPAGLAVEVLKRLVDASPKTVTNNDLDASEEHGNEAGEKLRRAISVIRKALDRGKAPYTITTKQGTGYALHHI